MKKTKNDSMDDVSVLAVGDMPTAGFAAAEPYVSWMFAKTESSAAQCK